MVRINAVLREDIVEGIDQIAKETGQAEVRFFGKPPRG